MHHTKGWNVLRLSVRYYAHDVFKSSLSVFLMFVCLQYAINAVLFLSFFFSSLVLIEDNIMPVFKINDLGAKLWGSSQAETTN